MKPLIAILSLVVPLTICIALFGNGPSAVLVVAPLIAATVFLLNVKTEPDQGTFLIQVFIVAFLLRAVAASLIFGYNAQPFFGEDGVVHEALGNSLYEYWNGTAALKPILRDWSRPWGLYYLEATVYSVVGRNPLAVSFLSCFCGAFTSVLIYLTTRRIYHNDTAARAAALMTALFPALIIWSSQIMKDGFVVFFVVLTIYSLTKLQDRFSVRDLAILVVSLTGIFSLRFYIFYFAAFACVGSFAFGSKKILANNLRWLGIASIFVVVAAYSGVLTVGTEQVERLSNLEGIQTSRSVLSKEAASGYSVDTDIRTFSGAASALPIGLLNLLLAPFPWQFSSIRSLLTLPEMIIWWTLIPFLFIGAKHTLFNRFREGIPMLLFTITLTIAYALFQTNVGTAYRQRTQIQVFLLVFIAVGWTILKERRDDRRLIERQRRIQFQRRSREPA